MFEFVITLFNRFILNYIAPGLDFILPFLTHAGAYGLGLISMFIAQKFSNDKYYRTETNELISVIADKPIENIPKEVEPNPYRFNEKFYYPIIEQPKIDWHSINVYTNDNEYLLQLLPKEQEQLILNSPRLLDDKTLKGY